MSRKKERATRGGVAPRDPRDPHVVRDAPAPPPDPAQTRARVVAVWGALAVFALWGVSPFVPGMGLWGTNALRFTGTAGWIIWAALVVLCALALTGKLDGTLDALGSVFDSSPRVVAAALAVVTAIVVLALPDRVYYTGDFLFRRGLNEVELQQSPLSPQLMPLDRFLHLEIAPAARDALGMTTVDTDRWIGALDAAVLALAAVWFARALRARGFAGLALAAAIVFGGGLSIFTGYGKSFVEMTVLVVAIAACALESVTRGRHTVPLAVFAVAYLGFHRTGFVVLPAVLVSLGLAWRAHGKDARVKRELLVAAAILIAGLAWLAPRAVSILRAYDTTHHAPGAMFAPLRLADLANVVLLLAPLLLAAVLAFAVRPRAGRGAETAVLATLALSFAALAAGSFPQQGVVRDVDVFVPNALAWTCLAALVLKGVLDDRRGPVAGRAAFVLLAASAATALVWMTHQNDTERGFARVRAIVAGPPLRPATERSMSLDFLGSAQFRLMRFNEATVAYKEAASVSPNPRFFVQWGVAAMRAGRKDEARVAVREAVARNPTLVPAWQMLAALAAEAGDFVEAERALAGALAQTPNDPQLAQQIRSIRAAAARDTSAARTPGATRGAVSPPASSR